MKEQTFIQVYSLNCWRCKREANITSKSKEEIETILKDLKVDKRKKEIALTIKK